MTARWGPCRCSQRTQPGWQAGRAGAAACGRAARADRTPLCFPFAGAGSAAANIPREAEAARARGLGAPVAWDLVFWSPVAQSVEVLLSESPVATPSEILPMSQDSSGVWRARVDASALPPTACYQYRIRAYHHLYQEVE